MNRNNKIKFYPFILILFAIFIVSFIIQYNKTNNKNLSNNLNIYDNKKVNKMAEKNFDNYKKLDHPDIISFLFHPRPDTSGSALPGNVTEFNIPVAQDVTIGANFFSSSKGLPTILFFHGNGEIVSDYTDLGPIYNKMGINFFPVDYRGYGKSTGKPTVSTMIADSHKIYDFAKTWLKDNSYTGSLVLMGRSLGSASVLELASTYPDEIKGLIIESGFAYSIPLLKLLGIRVEALGLTENDSFRNIDKIAKYKGPTLVIHAELDHIIPFTDGKALYEGSGAKNKNMLKIPQANHNNIFMYGLDDYLKAVKEMVDNI